MSGTKWLWRITGIMGLVATVVLIIGMVYGIRTVLYPKGEELTEAMPSATPAPSPAGGTDKIQILGLGDSLTKGVGDQSGEGYIGKVEKQLKASTNKPVYKWNFAVNGAVTEDLLAEINKPSSAEYIKQADIILFTIGGNDLNRIAATQAASPAPGAGGTTLPSEVQFNFEELAKKLPDSEKRLEEIVDKLAVLNPKARIIYVGLYHPFLEFDPNRAGAAWVGRWNNAAFLAANRHPNVTVVPTYDLFQQRGSELLFTDHFHPNGTGYEEIAARVMQVLK